MNAYIHIYMYGIHIQYIYINYIYVLNLFVGFIYTDITYKYWGEFISVSLFFRNISRTHNSFDV